MGVQQEGSSSGLGVPQSTGASLVSLRRVTIDEGHNRVHYTFGSNVYDRSYNMDPDMMTAALTCNVSMLGMM